MKPIVNYGLSDSLIDAVRKSVEEALVGGQKKLDVDKDGKLEKTDFASLRAKKDAVDTKPKLKEEQIDEISSELAGRASNARIDRNNSGGVSHTDLRKLRKGTTPLDQQSKTTAGYMKTLDRKNEEYEQMDEARYDNEADAQSIVNQLKEEHKDDNYSVRPVGSGYAVVHPYLSNFNVNGNIKKLREEYEQMDEAVNKSMARSTTDKG